MEFSDYLVTGDFARNRHGEIYEVVKVNRVNTVRRDKQGKLWNVRDILKKTEKPADWPENTAPKLRPGTVFHVKKSSGLYGRTWFKQYHDNTFFVATKTDAAKVNFVPLGGTGLPDATIGYSCSVDSVEVVDLSPVLANL